MLSGRGARAADGRAQAPTAQGKAGVKSVGKMSPEEISGSEV